MKKILAALLVSGTTGAFLAISGGLLTPNYDYHWISWLAGLGAVAGALLGTPLCLMVILGMLPRFSAARDSFWLLIGAIVGGLPALLLQSAALKGVGFEWTIVIIGPLIGGFISSIFLRRYAARDRFAR